MSFCIILSSVTNNTFQLIKLIYFVHYLFIYNCLQFDRLGSFQCCNCSLIYGSFNIISLTSSSLSSWRHSLWWAIASFRTLLQSPPIAHRRHPITSIGRRFSSICRTYYSVLYLLSLSFSIFCLCSICWESRLQINTICKDFLLRK